MKENILSKLFFLIFMLITLKEEFNSTFKISLMNSLRFLNKGSLPTGIFYFKPNEQQK